MLEWPTAAALRGLPLVSFMHLLVSSMLVALLGLSGAAAATPNAARVQQEIDRLFIVLGASGCEFQRNGRWHDAEQAASHLDRKRDYLVRKGLVTDAESLIERAASESSLTGRPYLVKCPGAGTVTSRAWLMQKLAEIRAHPTR